MPYLGAQPDKGNFADLNGAKLIIDADADTSITADTDDTIDIEIAGADDFQFTANTFTVLSGSTLAIASGATIANSGTATGFVAANPASADGDTLGTASLEWSDLYLADGGVVYFGNDQDVTITHDPDDGLFLKSIATADNNPFVLTLQTGETDIAADDVIGQIDFQAPDEGTGTDAILVAGSIRAVSEGDFSSSSNATSLNFFTGNSAAAGTDGGSLILGSTGNLTLKDLRTADGSSPTLTLQSGDTDMAADDILGKIAFQAPDEGAGTDAILVSAAIQARSETDFSASANATAIDFMTGASEAAATKMTLSSLGGLTVTPAAAGHAVFNEGAIDADFRIESSSNTNAFDLDGGLHGGVGAIGIGRNAENTVDVLIGNPAITADANQAHYRLRIVPAGAVTIPSGTASEVATLSVYEPNITATGTVTTAATVWIHDAPTEASSNYALYVDAGVSRFDANIEQPAGITFIGDTANAGMTQGLTINQGANDDYLFQLKSSDMAHNMTSQMEADSFFGIQKVSGTAGGALIQSFTESDGRGLFLICGHNSAMNTTKSTSGYGGFDVNSNTQTGTNYTTAGTDANLMSIGTNGGTQHIFDREGTYHANQGSTTFDAWDDAHLARSYDLATGKNTIDSKFDKFISYNHEKLAELKLVGREEDGTPNNFVNITGMQRLHNGAIWQQYEKHENLLNAVYELAVKAVGKDEADEILDKNEIKLLSKNKWLN